MLHAVAPPRTAAEASEEIRDLVAAGDLGRAGRRLLDFSKDFDVARELQNEAVQLVGRINLPRRRSRGLGQSANAATEQNELIGSLLELMDEMTVVREDSKAPALRVVPSPFGDPIGP